VGGGALKNMAINFEGSIKGGEFLDLLKFYQLLKKNCPRWNYMVISCCKFYRQEPTIRKNRNIRTR
jgi:hypothetical protein